MIEKPVRSVCPVSENGKSVSVKRALEIFGQEVESERVRNFDSFGIKNVNYHLSAFFQELTRQKIKSSFSRDQIIVQTVKYAEELDFVINKIFERIFEWFGLYYPEASLKAESVDKFHKTVRNSLDKKTIAKALGISDYTMGGEFYPKDVKALEQSIKAFDSLINERDSVKAYIEKLVLEIAPNASNIATPLLAAKLISEANGLKHLAGMPSSTIQIMGAEKALFRHLTTGAKSPKHGLIFQHPLMMKVKGNNRGKMARTLANKISLAVKSDYYSPGSDVSRNLLKQINERARSLK